MARLSNFLEYAPPSGDHRFDKWLERLVQNVNDGRASQPVTVLPTPTTATWAGFNAPMYELTSVPFATRTPYGSPPAWCTEGTATPSLIWSDNATGRVLVFERLYDRWRCGAAGATYLGGHQEVTITSPSYCLYVPQGTGTRRGKYWVGSTANDTITTIDPHSSFATSTFTLGVAESNVAQMVYDSYNDKVWAITGGATRICQIDPSDGSNDAQSTGWTNLQHIAATDAKLWLTKTSGLVTEKIQYLDAGTLATTNPGITASAAGCQGIRYLPEIDKLFVHDGGGTSTVRVINNATDAEDANYTTGSNIDGGAKAWIPELRCVVVGGNVTWYAIDVLTGATIYSGQSAYASLNLGGNQLNATEYISEYKEIVGMTGSGARCLVYPTPAYTTQ